METNDRLSAALLTASGITSKRDAKAKRTSFTTSTAAAANAKKYAYSPRKPKTSTVRVEADIIELVKVWPTYERVRYISEAIRGSVKAYETLEKVKNR